MSKGSRKKVTVTEPTDKIIDFNREATVFPFSQVNLPVENLDAGVPIEEQDMLEEVPEMKYVGQQLIENIKEEIAIGEEEIGMQTVEIKVEAFEFNDYYEEEKLKSPRHEVDIKLFLLHPVVVLEHLSQDVLMIWKGVKKEIIPETSEEKESSSAIFGFKSEAKSKSRRHIEKVHDEGFHCDICGFKGKHKKSIKRHIITHSSERKRWKCQICFKVILAKSKSGHLQRHDRDFVDMKSHALTCDICGKITRNIKIHIRQVHEKLPYGKTFDCGKCELKFTRLNDLRTHDIKTHFEGKVHVCHCGAVFREGRLLTVHKATHSSKTFECDLCPGKKYSKKSCVWSHRKKNHPEEFKRDAEAFRNRTLNFAQKAPDSDRIFACDLCPGRNYSKKSCLWSHRKRNHPEALKQDSEAKLAARISAKSKKIDKFL